MHECWKIAFSTTRPDAAETALEAFGASIWAREKQGDAVAFEVYLDTPPDLAALALPDDAIAEVIHLPPHDWVSESQQNLPPVRVPPFYLHGSHDKAMRGGWRSIEMQAGLAFGSGHHGTTQGCLHLFARVMKQHPRPRLIADIGCGSGTLAIAAAKLVRATQAGSIFASDMDADAVQVTRHNARRNGVAPQIRVFGAAGMAHPAYRAQRFDVIFANILAAPLIALAGDFERHLADNGVLIIAGLLTTQARGVKARYRACGLKPKHEIKIGQWTSLALMR